eukprot:622609-Pyramimonas_sp.AAC.1
MMIQQSLRWRLRRLGLHHIRDHKDITNAFGNTDWTHLSITNEAIMKPQAIRFGEQRFRRSAVAFQSPDGFLFAKPH